MHLFAVAEAVYFEIVHLLPDLSIVGLEQELGRLVKAFSLFVCKALGRGKGVPIAFSFSLDFLNSFLKVRVFRRR